MCDTDLVGFDVAYLVTAKQNAVRLPTAEPRRFSCGLRPAHESPVQRALKYAGIH
jgi:hypothetical protein